MENVNETIETLIVAYAVVVPLYSTFSRMQL